MKKEERLHRLLGDVDDDLVADAAGRSIPLRIWLPRVVAAVAAVVLMAGVVLAQPWDDDDSPIGGTTTTTTMQNDHNGESGEVDNSPSNQVPTHVAPLTTTQNGTTTIIATTTVNIGGEIWYEPKWDDKPIWQQFPEFERGIPEGYEGKMHYTVRETNIDKAMVEEYLEDVNLHGYDIYTETGYDMAGKVYRIKGISHFCAVALQYEGREDFFPAVNSGYTPETLGQFITDLNLKENMTVGKVYGNYLDEQNFTHTAEYEGLTAEVVWEMLLQKADAANEYDYEKVIEGDGSMRVCISVPLLGIHNFGLRVTTDGYLFTNVLETGKIFYIGEDATAAFMEYVRTNCRVSYDSGPISGDTTVPHAVNTSAAQPPLVTATTVYKPAH